MKYHWITCTGLVLPILLLMSKLTPANVVPKSPASVLMEEFSQWEIKNNPEWAMSTGINDERVAGPLDVLKMDDFQRITKEVDVFVTLAQHLPTPASDEELLNLNQFIEYLKQFVQSSKYIKFCSPVLFSEDPHNNFRRVVEDYLSYKYNTHEDYVNLLSLYDKLPVQVEECMAVMKESLASGLMPWCWNIYGVDKQLENLDLLVNQTFLYKPFTEFPHEIYENQKKLFLVAAQKAIENKVLPAFRKLKVFIVEEYSSNCRSKSEEFYQAALNFHTTTNLTAQQIHDIGLKEVQRIMADAKKTASKVGLGGLSIPEINNALRADPSTKFSSIEEVKEAYEDAYKKTLPLLSKLFHHMPPPTVLVKGHPSTFDHYVGPSGDKPGIFYFDAGLAIETYRKYLIMPLTLHETAPGHHLQVTYLLENDPNAPQFRKTIDHSRSSAIPANKFAFYTAYTEGWGLYSEYLGEELGLYDDPYKMLGRYSFELLRACRLVVDTGMHAFGWSGDKALQYLVDHSFHHQATLRREINHYITQPGRATAYKIGEIKIKELRKKAEDDLGKNFDIRDFHDIILRCYGPLTYVEKCVDDYIQKNCC